MSLDEKAIIQIIESIVIEERTRLWLINKWIYDTQSFYCCSDEDYFGVIGQRVRSREDGIWEFLTTFCENLGLDCSLIEEEIRLGVCKREEEIPPAEVFDWGEKKHLLEKDTFYRIILREQTMFQFYNPELDDVWYLVPLAKEHFATKEKT